MLAAFVFAAFVAGHEVHRVVKALSGDKNPGVFHYAFAEARAGDGAEVEKEFLI